MNTRLLLSFLAAMLSGTLAGAAIPSEPILIFPPNDGGQVGHTPPLMVRVAEPGGGKLTVRYFGRLAKSPGPDFTIVAMPDTQYYTGEMNGGKKEMIIAQTEWAISNRVSRNVAYVTQLGDISNNGDTPSYISQWYNATNAMYRLENPVRTQLPDGIAYGVAVGNHEMTPIGNADSGSTSNYNRYFGVSHFSGRSYYGGNYGANNNNHVDFFSASGMDFMAIYFEYDTSMNTPVLAWAGELLRTNPHRRAILVTHYFGSARTPSTFSTQGAAIYNALKGYTNIFLMLSGHVCGEGSRTDTFNGNTIRTLVADYQCYPNGGNGFMRLMEFSPSNNVVVVQTYSPWTGEYETDEDSEFFFPYTMPPSMPSSEPFRQLHVQTGIDSGQVASFSWPGLLPYRTYEWYVTVTDEANNTLTSPVWRFTTAPLGADRHDVAAGLLDVNQVPGFDGEDESTNCIVLQSLSVNDFRLGAFDRADYHVQIGPDRTRTSAEGVLISSVAQNGRDNYGTNLFATSGIEVNTEGDYRIVTYSSPNTASAAGSGYAYEYNINVAGAWFPYATWMGGLVRNSAGVDGGAWDHFTGSAGLALGTHITALGGGQAIIDMRSLGIDSRTDGVLLVNHARDEGNFALSQVNSANGTWNVFVKDNSAFSATEYEQDPFAFVFIPRTNSAVVSGRFLADGTIAMFSGETPGFTVTPLGMGRWELKMIGRTPAEGVLVISAEGGMADNRDNIVSSQVNADGDGWEIQSRDTPSNVLQTPNATEPVVSFVYIPTLRPNVVITPTQLVTAENGGTAAFTLLLDTQPSADVVITLTSSDLTEGTVAPASVTFTTNDWRVRRTVTVSGVNDSEVDGNIAYFIHVAVSSADTNYNVLKPCPISVVNLDDEPQIFLGTGAVSYGIGMPGMTLDGQAVLLDAAGQYSGATLTVAITANAAGADRLEIRPTGSGPGQIGIFGNQVRYGNIAIGTFSGGQGTPLLIALESTATPAAVQALIRAITFGNSSVNPSLDPRQVTFLLTKAGGSMAAATTTVRVSLVRMAQFQQGMDHGYGMYNSAADCSITPLQANTPLNIGPNGDYAIWMDAPATGATEGNQALLRFSDIVGNAPGQIPPNATIVSAELVLTIPPNISNASGQASPLYRMLVAWNPNTTTWNSAGGGFQTDNVQARASYDSFFGLSNGDASTGTGTISLGVTADVIAWVTGGEPNHGWLMPGWLPPASAAPRTDGTAFAACEWPYNVAERPLLRVAWLPANAAGASFRRGVNGYTGAQDTRIRASAPTSEFATTVSLYSDWAVSSSSDNEHVLLQFQDIIGVAAGQVPPGARIDAAVLDLASVVGNAMGDGGQFHALLKPWQDTTSTWNWWGNGIQADDIEAASIPTTAAGNATCQPNVQAAFHSFDLTPDVQAWTHGLRQNHGWVILPWPGGGDGWGFASAETTTVRDRPQLRVFYTTPGAGDISMLAPVPDTGQVQVRFAGLVSTACTIERAPALTGPWTIMGTAFVGADGVGTFTDAAPPPHTAYYRVRFP